MKTIKTIAKKYVKIIVILFYALAMSGCQGLDDWSDLKNVGDIFDDKSGEKSDADFIRYGAVPMSSQPIVEYLVDYSNVQSKVFAANIQKACDYTKIPFKTTNAQAFSVPTATTRVIAIMDTKKLSDAAITKLLEFVSNGGTLFVPFASEDHRMAFFYGFKPDAQFDTDSKAKGYRYTTPILPTLKGMTNYEAVPLFGFAKQNFSNKVKLLAAAANDPSYPAIVQNEIGKGKVILYNTSAYIIKEDRGFIFAGLLKGLEGVPYPVANTSTVFLDDFPSPLYDIKSEPVKSEFDMTMADYYTKVWWPDMIKVAKEFNIKYSAMIAFDYKNKVVPPFTFDQWNTKKIKTKDKVEPMSDWLMRDVTRNGHELAFHGYNHVEYTRALWKNQEFIQLALKSVKKKWDAGNFGPMPVTYVPPSNIIDDSGLVALKKGMPSIKYMCSLYMGETKDGGNREFDYDPFNKDLFDYPRISSGFYMPNEEKYILHSEYILTGVWNHFIHPDDIYQIPATANASAGDFDLRNKQALGWYKTPGKDNAMLPEFKKYLTTMIANYPQLRFVSAGEGGKIVINWRASRYSHKTEKGLYAVNEINPDADGKKYWFMYGSQENAGRLETQLKTQNTLFSRTPFMDGFLYSAYTNKPNLTSIDLLYKTPEEKKEQVRITAGVVANFTSFNELARKYATGTIWVDNSEKLLKQEMENLRNKMLTEPKIDSVTWNKYAKYLSWEDKGDEVWQMLDAHVKKYPLDENVMYSKELDRVIGYTNDIDREKWMSAQLLVTPNDKALLKDYIDSFNSEDNTLKIKNALKTLASLEPTVENQKSYIAHLLQYYPDEAHAALADIAPSDVFGSEIATTIVYLYADKNEYKKAYEWSKFSKEIDFPTKMSWLIELKDYKTLEKDYTAYIAEHPDDFKSKALMATVYHELGRFKESWVLANSLPESPEKEELRKMLNTDVVFEKPDLQNYLVANEAELFYPNIMKAIIKEDRLLRGNYIDVASSLETNQSNPSIFKNRASYNFRDKKGNVHSAGITYNQYYKLDLKQKLPFNEANSLKGIEYKFAKAEDPDVEGKIQYWSRARVSFDDNTKLFYEFGAGASRSKNKRFTSAELNVFPVETAPGLNQGIYQAKLNLYQDMYLFKKINASLSMEGSYYTKGLLTIDTISTAPISNPDQKPNPNARHVFEPLTADSYVDTNYKDALEGSAMLRLAWDNGEEKKSKLIPYLEAQYSNGSLDQPEGYPYWMIKERLYGGGGLGWEFHSGNFKSKVEAGYFLDDYSKDFQRYSGNIEYQLFDYTALMLNFELFSQKKYYSNSFQLGIKYNLKKKIRKTK